MPAARRTPLPASQTLQKTGNHKLYNDIHVANAYAAANALQPPERAILSVLKDRLAGMDMLEVGVGAGRATQHVAGRARSYHGVDLAAAMVALCQTRFPDHTFAVGDAENLGEYAGESFDFVLFSFNGIDCLDTAGRVRALREFHRVLRPGGALAFSGHNINHIPWGRAPELEAPGAAERLRNFLRFIRHGRSVRYLDGRDTAIVVERHFGRSIELFYATPAWQVRVLREMNWRNIRLFSGDSGREYDTTGEEYRRIGDPWIYYLCEK